MVDDNPFKLPGASRVAQALGGFRLDPSPFAAPRAMGDKVFGYNIRQPYPSERDYFQKNQHVSGMAAEDDHIILNPFSQLSPQQQHSVARNEAARLHMRKSNYEFDFDPTPEQMKSFSGTAYANDQNAMRSTILARIVSGDPSAGNVTDRQQQWADFILSQLEGQK